MVQDQEMDQAQQEYDQKWIQIISECLQSDLSIKEWCKQNNVSYQACMKNRRRLFPEDVQSIDFMEQETTWSTLNMEIPSSSLDIMVNDCRIVVTAGFDQELLGEVVEVLKRAPESK
jgi:hypothetical protein